MAYWCLSYEQDYLTVSWDIRNCSFVIYRVSNCQARVQTMSSPDHVRNPSSVIRLSSVIHHLSSVIHHPSSVMCHPSSVIRHPSSIICHPSSVIRHPSDNISVLSSSLLHLIRAWLWRSPSCFQYIYNVKPQLIDYLHRSYFVQMTLHWEANVIILP